MPRAIFSWFFLLAVLVAVQPSKLCAADAPSVALPVGQIKVVRVVGDAMVVNPADNVRFPVKNGTLLMEGQILITARTASVLFVLSNGATVTLGGDAVLKIEAFGQKPFSEPFKLNEVSSEPSVSKTRLNLLRGELISDVKKLNKGAGSTFIIKTPVGAAGIRGTIFRLSFRPVQDQASFGLVMLEGLIEQSFGPRHRALMVAQGKQVLIRDIPFNAANGEITELPAVGEPTDVPAAALAALQQKVSEMMAAVETLTFPPSPNASGDGSGGGEPPENNQPTGEQPSAVPAPASVSASPQAQVPAARTSSTDGKPGS